MPCSEQAIRSLVEIAAGIHTRVRRWSERRLKSHGMTYPQYGAMSILSPHPGLTQRELAQALQADTTTAMVICDALERRNWLQRRPDPSDRRMNRLHLTTAGQSAYRRAKPEIDAGLAAVAAAISDREARTALASLERIYRAITEITS